MPRIYHPQTTVYRLIPSQLQLRIVSGKPCEILDWNFQRIRRNMFGGENPSEDVSESDVSAGVGRRMMRTVRWMNVTVVKPCAQFPYLEMDESCMYFHL